MLHSIVDLSWHPLGVEGHALCTVGEGGHGGGAAGVLVTEVRVGVPPLESVSCFLRIRRPGDGGAHAAGELRYGGTAHGVKADVPQPLRIAPCDMDDLLDGLGGEGQSRLLPCNGHVGLFVQ